MADRIVLNIKTKKIITVLSGGLDSTTLAYFLQNQGYEQMFVSFNYGQRHKRELDFAAVTAQKLRGKHHVIGLESLSNLLSGSALTDNVPVPEGHYAADNMAITIVPGRNAMMLSIAWAIAVAEKVNLIAFGPHNGDAAIYADCLPSFIGALGLALKLGSGIQSLQDVILTPFLYKSKAEIVGEGLRLGVPFEDTYSCYNGKEVACGVCGTCVERLQAFSENNSADPLEYEDRTTWKKHVEDFQTKKASA